MLPDHRPKACHQGWLQQAGGESRLGQVEEQENGGRSFESRSYHACRLEYGDSSPATFGTNCASIWEVANAPCSASFAKKGREMVQYKDMAEIKEKFANDIVNATINPEQSSQAAASSDDKSSVKALAEATDAKAIALQAHKHIKLGGHYTFKNEKKIWLLTDVTDERVKLVHRPFFEPEEKKEVLHKDLKILKEWTKQVPHLVGDAVRSKMLPCASPFMQEELAKARAQVALYEKFLEHLNCITVLWQRWLMNVLLKCLCVIFCVFPHQDWRRGCAGFQSEPDLCWHEDQQGQAVTASYGLLASSLC